MSHKYPISWFEIPALNFQRAVNFYSTVIGRDLPAHEMNGSQMAFFSTDPLEVSGVIIQGEGAEPSAKGVLVYLNGGDDLSVLLDRVEDAGGSVVVPKTLISDTLGYFGIFIDSEGNRLALHSMG